MSELINPPVIWPETLEDRIRTLTAENERLREQYGEMKQLRSMSLQAVMNLTARNRALVEALDKYGAAYRRVMEQAGMLDSDVWYAVTKAQAFAAALTEPTPPAGGQG